MRRRIFLASLSTASLPIRSRASIKSDPFRLGVASGDPAADGVVLWTRLAPDPVTGGGMPDANVPVDWELAEDEKLSRVVQKGQVVATPGLAHSVHVEVRGLKPHRPYWYRFRAAGFASPTGATSTAPAPAPPGARAPKLRFAFASCQHWEQGLFTAYEHMAGENADLVVHLGDYIYEGAARENLVRRHNSAEIVSLNDYRNRHALYKTDPALQAMHAAVPWIVTWDDHEVDNNYAADVPEDRQTRTGFLERRANAYQAYYEHMPLRLFARPHGSRMRLYRAVHYGNLATFFVLDTRQYRTDQPCGDATRPVCGGERDPKADMLGPEQEKWLLAGLARSQARWNVLAQQVLLARVDMEPGPGERLSMDQWSGYEAARRRLLGFLGERKPSNPIVITGDIHAHWAADLKTDFLDERAPVVGSEFTGTSISSGGDGGGLPDNYVQIARENPHVKYHSRRRGYVVCELDDRQCRAGYRVLDYVTRAGSPINKDASFVIENGRPGLQTG
jgi:alkaline phosphatase D